jgi:23S rRNA (cytosine1962-C5)-methyltransferase
VAARVTGAWQLRQALLSSDTTAYRLINGEGDGMPGIVVDVYGPYAVVATYGLAVQPLLALVVTALKQVLAPAGILVRRMTADEAGPAVPQWVYGEPAPSDLRIMEHGVQFYADLMQGHKTGLYLDQRENRQTLGQFSRGASVLNLYAYTGGFSVTAALSGARRVTSVDIAAPALQRAQDNFRLNQLDPAQHQFVVRDCYDFLKASAAANERYDTIVCDPPSMAHSRAQLDDALHAYSLLSALGLRLVRDGGFYAASSCTAQVSPEIFRQMLVQSARRVGRVAQIVHEAGHAWDHPVNLAHPEGRYLKFVILRVTEV